MHRRPEPPHPRTVRNIAIKGAATGVLTGAIMAIAAAAVLEVPTASAGRPSSNSESRVPPALNAPRPAPTDGPIVQLALLLDTSNSMDGLIDQARAQLWSVVSELSGIERDCKPVQLQVALFQYGNNGLESADGFIQLRTPFTTDLDIISEQLFALRTNGGSEYCGQVIDEAANRLAWIAPVDEPGAPPVTRLIVIAGNEPFTQGTTPYQSAIPTATNKGIAVHTVFCGPKQEGVNTFWKAGATLGEGRYCAIDQSRTVVDIPTPFDDAIGRLDAELNDTYIRFGAVGRASAERQTVQDAMNAEVSVRSRARRSSSKASGMYSNSTWDLVDAMADPGFDLDEIDKATLPEELRTMTTEELAQVIAAKAAMREAVQAKIRQNSAARDRYLAENQDQGANAGTLEGVLLDAIHESFEPAPDKPGAAAVPIPE